MSNTFDPSGQAVVVGGSLGGLLAARVLSDHFARVTVIERDGLPSSGAHRRGVPQDVHTHTLIASGLAAMENLFPGLTDGMVAHGGTVADLQGECLWYLDGHRMKQAAMGVNVLLAGRPLLEGQIRDRVRAIGNVSFRDGAEVAGLTVDGARERVTGVTVLDGSGTSPTATVGADLVVDATGRGARGITWLRESGFPVPEEEKVDIGIVYTTRHFKRRPEHLDGNHALIITTTRDNRRGGAMIAQEDDTWIVSLFGYLGESAPLDLKGFVEFAGSLETKDLYHVIRDAEPLGEAVPIRFPASRRRHYERLERFPQGYVVLGDALCSFNPVYAQGMSVLSLEAQVLADCLRAGMHKPGRDGQSSLATEFFAGVTPTLDVAWSTATGGDLRYPEVDGVRTPEMAAAGEFLGRVYFAASRNTRVGSTFARVTNLLEGPEALQEPDFIEKVNGAFTHG